MSQQKHVFSQQGRVLSGEPDSDGRQDSHAMTHARGLPLGPLGKEKRDKKHVRAKSKEQPKRKTSVELASESKRVNVDLHSDQEDLNTEADKATDFVSTYIKALENPRVRALLALSMEEQLEKRCVVIENRVDIIEADNSTRDAKVTNLEARVEQLEQQARDRNAVITGLSREKMTCDDVVEELNLAMAGNLTVDEIETTISLPKLNDSTRYVITFKSKARKVQFMKLKGNLKGKPIGVSDHLTPQRAKLAYECRQLQRSKTIKQTWVYDSKVFIKKDENSKPQKISSIGEIQE